MKFELEIGKEYNGFVLEKITDCPDYNGCGYFFRHKRTNFEVFYFYSDDEECFFSYNVYTPPFDNTGVFHIIEHTVLTGSKKYPVRDPFMSLERNSCNTFLNAMTGLDRTYYPASSPVKKDFDNIFSVYSDAVFCPLLRRESFMQEGIRLSKENSLHFEGVVFSEMTGDVSTHSSVVMSTSTGYLFDENSPYRYEAGGDPPFITDLTYEKFVATYKEYYVPSNMTLFLYGDLDIKEKLKFLDDEYLSRRESGVRKERIVLPERWKEARSVKKKSLGEEGAEGATVMLSWVLGDVKDPLLTLEASLITDVLLGTPGSPLYKAIIDSKLGTDVSDEGGLNDTTSALTFSAGFYGTKENNANECESFLLSTLENIASSGLDKKMVEASIRRMEFKLQEIKEGIPNGYRIFFDRIDKVWAYGGDPVSMLSSKKIIRELRDNLEKDERYLEKWIEKNLINNSHRLLTIVTMDDTIESEINKKIEEKLVQHKNEYNEEYDRAYLEYQNSEDSEEDIKKLPRLTLSDIPSVMRVIDRSVDNSVLTSSIKTNGISYADFAFEISDFSIEEKEYAFIVSKALTLVDVGTISFSDYITQLKFLTGSFSSSMEVGTTVEGEERDFIIFRFKALKEHFAETLNLLLPLFKESNFFQEERIKDILKDIQSDYENGVIRYGHSFALTSALSSLSPALYTEERIRGLSFWYKTNELLENGLNSIGQKLADVAKKAFVSSRLTFHLTSDEDSISSLKEDIFSFISALEKGEKCEKIRPSRIEKRERNRAYLFSSPLSYTSLAAPASNPESKDAASERMFLSLVSTSSLWSLIREKGGAYGAGCGLDINENVIYFYTYRDPRLDDSIKDFVFALKSEELSEEKLENLKNKVLSRDIRPMGPQSKGILDLRRYLYMITDEERQRIKENLLSVENSDMERVREKLIKRIEDEGYVTTICGRKLVSTSSLDFVLNELPFVSHSS